MLQLCLGNIGDENVTQTVDFKEVKTQPQSNRSSDFFGLKLTQKDD